MTPNGPGSLVAAASVVAGTGAATVARGCVTARTGAGVYTVTLDQALDAADGVCMATVRGANPVALQVVHTSDTVKTVNGLALAAGQAATDADFDFVAFRVANGTLN